MSVGFALIMSSMAFGAPTFYGTLGNVGYVPGLTVAALAVLSDDHLTIERLMRAMCGAGILFGLLSLSRALPIIKPFFDNSRPCTDYLSHSDAPCWVSAAQAGVYVLQALLLFKVVAHRFFVGLSTTRAGRHDLMLAGLGVISRRVCCNQRVVLPTAAFVLPRGSRVLALLARRA